MLFRSIEANVLYDQKRTNLTAGQLQEVVKTAIQNFADSTLNTFNSTFSNSDLMIAIQSADNSIITNECIIQIQKKFYPLLGSEASYVLNYGVPLERGVFSAGIYSYPTFQYYVSSVPPVLENAVYIEEVPFPTSGLDSIKIINPGFN